MLTGDNCLVLRHRAGQAGANMAGAGADLASSDDVRIGQHLAQALVVPVQPLLYACLVAAAHLLPVPHMVGQQGLRSRQTMSHPLQITCQHAVAHESRP